MKRFRCTICGYIHEGDMPPETCPICDAPAELFELESQSVAVDEANSYRCINCDYTAQELPDVCPVCGLGSDSFEPVMAPEVSEITSTIKEVVILGSGIAGLSAAETLREMDSSVNITMITNEDCETYYRLNLTRYLCDEVDKASLPVHEPSWYSENRINLELEKIVTEIQADAKKVVTSDGRSYAYDKLMVTLGAHPFIPPIEGISQPGIFTLRDIGDANEIKGYVEEGTKVLVMGGGVLGLEIAGALAEIGGHVKVVEGASWLMPIQLNETAAGYIEEVLHQKGIQLDYDYRTVNIDKREDAFLVEAEDGRKTKAEIIVLATGVRSNTYLLRMAGLEVNRGLVVDDHLLTSHPDIYAAGDITEHYGVTYGLWNVAQYQGKIAAMNLLGVKTDFGGVPRSNALKVLDVDMFSIGEIGLPDGSFSLLEKADDAAYICFIIKDLQVVGGIAIGYGTQAYGLKGLVEEGRHLTTGQARDVSKVIDLL